MIKKILPISVIILVLIFIILLGLQNMLNKNKSQGNSSLTPTIFQGRQGSGLMPQTGSTRSNSSSGQQVTSEELQKKLPIIASDFTLDYSARMQKYVVTLKADENQGSSNSSNTGQTAYNQWLTQNQSYEPLLPPDQVIIAHQSVAELNDALDYAEKNKLSPEQEFKKNNDTILSIINTLFSPISVPQQSIPLPSLTPTPNPTPVEDKPQTNSGSGGYVYYAQCGGQYDNYLLPIQNGTNGKKCTECSAGCGPTTAAMILSSYVDSTQTPPKVIESMSKAGVSISCNGSGLYQLYGYMSNVTGIKVSSIMTLGHVQAKDVVGDFRNYINGGWTLFVLADCKYGGHYFWVTDVTADGKILAFDPAYGSGKPTPFNENQYDPYPYYTYAFAVKKS